MFVSEPADCYLRQGDGGAILFPKTVLALRGSYGVAFREGPWTRIRCTDAAGQHFPPFLQHKINVTLKNLYVSEEINVQRRCRAAFFFHSIKRNQCHSQNLYVLEEIE